MKVEFTDEIPTENHSEIEDVLRRIAIGTGEGRWAPPDRIEIRGRLTGGRGSSDVLEAIVHRGRQQSLKVIKLGPHYDLKNEFEGFKVLKDPNRFFVRIEAVTPGLLGEEEPIGKEREAVVYDHGMRHAGKQGAVIRTFESAAKDAVRSGDPAFKEALAALEELLKGVRNNLYDRSEVVEEQSFQRKAWNRRLGNDAVVAVDKALTSQSLLVKEDPASAVRIRARELAQHAVEPEPRPAPGALVYLEGVRLEWWGQSLMAEVDSPYYLRIQVIADGDTPISKLANRCKSNATVTLHGRPEAWR
jgi:hypothetical protein